LPSTDSFKPKVVSSSFFTKTVAEQLAKNSEGADVVIRGDREQHYTEVAHDRDLEEHELSHHAQNVRLMLGKYRGPEDKHSQLLVNKFR
jgi:hypothetical protein